MATIAVALPGEITQKDKIEKMVKKRRLNFDYISRLHAGGGGGGDTEIHGLNVAQIRRRDILEFYDEGTLSKRAGNLFYLGLSLGRMIMLPYDDLSMVRSCAQLITEYEHHMSNSASQNLVRLRWEREGGGERGEGGGSWWWCACACACACVFLLRFVFVCEL